MARLRGKVFLSSAAAIFSAKLSVGIINLCAADNFCDYSALGEEGVLLRFAADVKGGFYKLIKN